MLPSMKNILCNCREKNYAAAAYMHVCWTCKQPVLNISILICSMVSLLTLTTISYIYAVMHTKQSSTEELNRTHRRWCCNSSLSLSLNPYFALFIIVMHIHNNLSAFENYIYVNIHKVNKREAKETTDKCRIEQKKVKLKLCKIIYKKREASPSPPPT